MGSTCEKEERSASSRLDDEPPMNERGAGGTIFLQALIVRSFVMGVG
jgi:hypothetical protein